jgi:hypothetical protein
MVRLPVRRPSTALIVSTIALVVALGGTSYAAFSLPNNSVGTRQIRNKAVTLTKIAPAAQHALSKVGPPGNPGVQGPQGPQGPQGTPGPKGADFTTATTLQSGQTEVGSYAVTGYTTSALMLEAVNLRVPLPSATDKIEFHNGAVSANCPGPGQAAPGYLCIYKFSGAATFDHVLDEFAGIANQASATGFLLEFTADSTGSYSDGTWAITAP